MNLGVDLAYHVDSLQLVFPPSDGNPSNASATPQDSRTHIAEADYESQLTYDILVAFALSVTPGIASNATITAHLIPSVRIYLISLDATL